MSSLEQRRADREDQPPRPRVNWWGALGLALVATFGAGSLVLWIWAILTFFLGGGVP